MNAAEGEEAQRIIIDSSGHRIVGSSWHSGSSRASRPIERHGISSLPLDESALAHLEKLPAVHRDPFDRMLVCQAIQHELEIATTDEVVQRYPVKTVWLNDE